MITQEYFDEVCLENAQLFELSDKDAVQETLQQLGPDQCAHLIQTFPSDACPDRLSRRDFVERLERLSVRAAAGARMDPDEQEQTRLDLESVHDCLEADYSAYSQLLEVNNGIECIASYLSSDLGVPVQQAGLSGLLSALKKPPPSLLQQFQEYSIQKGIVQWLKAAWKDTVGNKSEPKQYHACYELIDLVCICCKGNQAMKHFWMKDTEDPILATLLMDSLQQHPSETQTVISACKLITLLCTFDDFSSANQSDPSLATAHSHVQALAAAGAIDALKQALQRSEQPACTTAVLGAVRSLAIQNQVVQEIFSNGMLQLSVSMFRSTVDQIEQAQDATNQSVDVTATRNDQLAMISACLGLFRNLCANDDLKHILCEGNMSVVAPLVTAMRLGTSVAVLQEHACGMIAAMALRQPQNAECLLEAQIAPQIIQAMQRYPERSSLQRQGCLAIRNLASRSSPERKHDLLAFALEPLRNIAAKHLDCQDEVFAALRDLGVDQAHTFVVQEPETGRLVTRARQTFGQGLNQNFRSVYD